MPQPAKKRDLDFRHVYDALFVVFDGQEEVGELELADEFKVETWAIRILYKKFERENLSAKFHGTFELAKQRFADLLDQAIRHAVKLRNEREIAREATQLSIDQETLESRRRVLAQQELIKFKLEDAEQSRRRVLAQREREKLELEAAEQSRRRVLAQQEREKLEVEAAEQCKVAGECRRCGEELWQIRSVSPNYKSVIWQCEYCGSVVMVRRQVGNIVERSNRRSIPKEVKREVWRRDQGRCMTCGSRENLEFDHIIPLSKGGANTVRNLQLLCQNCNREKSDNIG
jgi:5-methylcytosine-specific restriction endonuclease McrA